MRESSSNDSHGAGSKGRKEEEDEGDSLILPGDPEDVFDVEEQLGEGSFGVVYLAWHEQYGQVISRRLCG